MRMKFIFYNSFVLLSITDTVFLIGFMLTDGKTRQTKNILTWIGKLSLSSFFFATWYCLCKEEYLVPLSSGFSLASEMSYNLPLYWEFSASNTNWSDLVFMMSCWHSLLLTRELDIVLGGEIPAFSILQYPVLWSTDPPRMGTVERKWERRPSATFFAAQCKKQDSSQIPLSSPISSWFSTVMLDILPSQKVCNVPRLFASKREYRLSMFLN